MVNDKLLAVDSETHAFVNSLKLVPKDPAGDCLKRLLVEHGLMKLKDGESVGSICIPAESPESSEE